VVNNLIQFSGVATQMDIELAEIDHVSRLHPACIISLGSVPGPSPAITRVAGISIKDRCQRSQQQTRSDHGDSGRSGCVCSMLFPYTLRSSRDKSLTLPGYM
jgi:hypothetical protein